MQSEKEFLRGFEECFSELDDTRQICKVFYPLLEVIFLSLMSIAGGAGDWREIEFFGKSHLNAFRQYYPFENGMPSDDTIRRVFEALDPKRLNEILMKYFGVSLAKDQVIIDGKSLNGSAYNGIRALHFLNVYAAGSGITLYGKAIDKKDNEITAIPEAIEALDIKGATVTIDAMGCQKNIAKLIIEKEADYILGLKANHVTLYNEVKTAFETNAESFFSMDKAHTEEKGHGRIEERTCRVIKDFSKIPSHKAWPGIASVIEVKRVTTTKGKTSEATNYYISSLNAPADKMMQSIRDHWKIESMHWVLDVVFKEDASSMRKGNIPANMAIARRFVLNILNQIKEKRETRPMLMNMIGWSEDYFHKYGRKLMEGS